MLARIAAELNLRGHRGPLVEAVLRAQAPRSLEELPPQLRELAEKYRNAVAEVLGVPPEAIREDLVVRWATHWAKAMVKPEYWHMVESKLQGLAWA